MSLFGTNIKKIRTVKKLSQTAFADLFNLSRASIGAYEEGRAEAKVDTIIEIANYFGIRVDLFLTKKLTINEIYHVDIFDEKRIKASSGQQQANAIPFVAAHQYDLYLTKYQQTKFIQQLPTITLGKRPKAENRAFEYMGHDMSYLEQGIHAGDWLITSQVREATEKQLFVLLTNEQLILCRIIKIKEATYNLKADHPDAVVVELAKSAVIELWLVDSIYSTYIPSVSNISERLSAIEKKQRLQEEVFKTIKGTQNN